MKNKLFCGDNLEIMRKMPDCSVDLIATDPPYNSKKDYDDFDDRWLSDEHYLDFMRSRFVEIHRVLKDTGSLYLHCDPTMSHYLKVELDKVFGKENFQNEIVWAYNSGGGTKTRFGRKHDILLYYTKITGKHIFHVDNVRVPYSSIIPKKWKDKFNDKGKVSSDVISHISRLSNCHKERLGYPTQKPCELYEFFIQVSSNTHDLIFDPFCGSGTTLVAAKLLQRFYIGIDSNKNAIDITTKRLEEIIF